MRPGRVHVLVTGCFGVHGAVPSAQAGVAPQIVWPVGCVASAQVVCILGMGQSRWIGSATWIPIRVTHSMHLLNTHRVQSIIGDKHALVTSAHEALHASWHEIKVDAQCLA